VASAVEELVGARSIPGGMPYSAEMVLGKWAAPLGSHPLAADAPVRLVGVRGGPVTVRDLNRAQPALLIAPGEGH